MSEDNSGPINALKFVVDSVFGVAKQVIGIVFSRDDLEEEGKAQQDKASAERDVAQKEAEAEAARAEANVQESRQKGASKSK